MAYTTKNAVGEVVLINIIRLLYISVCVSFFAPMFKGEVVWFGMEFTATPYAMTGFDAIFGIEGTTANGHPLALVMFVFPIIAVIVTLLDFIYKRLHIAMYIIGGLGILMTVVFAAAAISSLNDSISIFGITLLEVRSGLSWGIFVPLGFYALSIGAAFLFDRVADN
jgi:hypothetical protein